MKAPVGLLSDGTVCVSRWRGFALTSSMQVSVEDEIRNHRLTDINHNMISGGHEYEVRCNSPLFVLPQCTNSSMVYNTPIVLSAKEC